MYICIFKQVKYFIRIILFAVFLGLGNLCYSQQPDVPTLISISVVPDSVPTLINVEWIECDSAFVIGYKILKETSGQWGDVAYVSGKATTSFRFYYNTYFTGDYQPISLRLESISEQSNSSITPPQTSILLNAINYDKCDTVIKLAWTAYDGWHNGVEKYGIYRRTATTDYELVSYANTLTFTDNTAQPFYTYYYYIAAFSSEGYIATSNVEKIFTESNIPPGYVSADYATVVNSTIMVMFTVDPFSTDVEKYYIKRKDFNSNGEYLLIDEIPDSAQSQIIYIDKKVKPNEYSYSYIISSISSCGVETMVSNPATTILLKAQSLNDITGKLNWTEYNYWENLVLEYKVYLEFNDSAYFVGTSSYYDFEYYHDLDKFVVNNQNNKVEMNYRVCYSVEAIENYTDTIRVAYKSRSNIACMSKESIIFVPTAFNPSSEFAINQEFRPIISFIDLEGYEFKIFDRFGNRVFQTTNLYEGWDGKLKNGNYAEQQVYSYLIKYKDLDGKIKRKSGTVTVIFK